MTIVGIDPGAGASGFVSLDPRANVLRAVLVTGDNGITPEYLGELVDTLEDIVDSCPGRPVVAIEDVVHPNPHMGLSNMSGLLGTAQVLGALRAHLVGTDLQVVIVRPGGHGSRALASYPRQLVGAREKHGAGKLRHLRSAYDIGMAARRDASVLALGGVPA